MRVVLIGGSPAARSRSAVLLECAQQWCLQAGMEVVSYQVRDFAAEDLLHARFDSPQVRELCAQVAGADGVIVATPVYKASFSGALKTLLDLLPERALEHKVVLPLACGGSAAHLLALDYALKPVLAALKAQEMLHGVYAEESLISYAEQERPASLNSALQIRLQDSLEQFQAALVRRPKPLCPQLLGERLMSARWSI